MTSLIAETKHLLRMGIEVPKSARALLMQEATLRGHVAALTSLLTVRCLLSCLLSDYCAIVGGHHKA